MFSDHVEIIKLPKSGVKKSLVFLHIIYVKVLQMLAGVSVVSW